MEAKVVRDYILYLRFENGKEGTIDISQVIPFSGIFEKLSDPIYFSQVQINKELGTIVWENGADLSPKFLYDTIFDEAA